MHKIQFKSSAMALAMAAVLSGQMTAAIADTFNTEATSDTFLSSDPNYANSDMSGYGAMMISANLPDPVQGVNYARTMDTLVGYQMASTEVYFNNEYGAGNWHVTDVQVEWYTNFDILGVPANNNQFNVPAAGTFNISLLTDNNWFNNVVTGSTGQANTNLNWNSVFNGGVYSNLLTGAQTLGTYTYTGGNFNSTTSCANNVCDPRFWDLGQNAALYNAITGGGTVSLFGSAADSTISYLINQMTKPGAAPEIYVTAAVGAPVPIPGALWVFLSALVTMLGISDRRSSLWGMKAYFA